MRVEAYQRLGDCPAELPVVWNSLLAPDRVTQGVDSTATFEWHASLMESFLGDAQARLLIARDGARIAGLLPVYQVRAANGRPVRGRIATWSELYCGRTGLLLGEPVDAVLRALISDLGSHFPDWNCLEMTLSDGSVELGALARALGDRCLAVAPVPLERSPYIALPERFDDYFQTLRPSFRIEVGRGTRRLEEQGPVERRLFRSPADVEPLWEAVCAIERQSWKESAGTSITTHPDQSRFYKDLLPRAAAAGQLFSTVLYLSGRPVAHQLCLRRDATATILKMSFVEDLRRQYPATVLLVGYIRDMIDLGFRSLDFMGLCDDFKMRWTPLTYGRTKYLVYRRNAGGHMAYWRRGASQLLARANGANKQVETGS